MIMVAKVFKPTVLLLGAYFLQVTQQAETVLGKALEYGLSFGLLVLACVILWREWKGEEKYNKERDDRLEVLIENNTAAMRDTKNAIDDMRDELKVLHERTNENRDMINRWHQNH